MSNEQFEYHTSSIQNWPANFVAMSAYLAPVILGYVPLVRYVAWAYPLVLYFIEKDSKMVKFHAMQSLLLNGIASLINFIVLNFLGGLVISLFSLLHIELFIWSTAVILTILGMVIALFFLVIDIIAFVGALQFRATKIPLVGQLADYLIKTFPA
ncbi:MAG: hypothetical protein ACRDBX_03665 [Erysipelotrichaceae bacterium]